MVSRLRDWLVDRSTVGPEAIQAMNRGLPRGVGWLHTLGSVAMALIGLQAITGIVLGMYYSPHPDAAYETTRFIDHQLPMGLFVRSIHHYGDSALIVVVLAHLLRTFFQGAYKAPRELNWILGIILVQLVIGFGFTGALLPWDQNAYKATDTRVSYPSSVPVVGPLIQTVLLGGRDIGALTLTRFYAIHALLLPALILLLVRAHSVLAWRKGPTPPGARVGEESQVPIASRFVEHQLFRNAVAILATFLVVFVLAAVKPIELEFKANPADATYTPRAEWYFLFLFQFVKDFDHIPGLAALPSWFPALVIPGIGITFLALAPWIDRSPERRAARRPLMIGAVVVGLLGAVGLTIRAYSQLHPNATPQNSLYAQFTDRGEKGLPTALVEEGKAAFGACGGCHTAYGDFKSSMGPDLTGYGRKTFLAHLEGHPEIGKLGFYERYKGYVRGDLRPESTKMPKYTPEMLTDAKMDAIGAYLSQDPAEAQVQHKDPRGATPPGE